METTVKERLIEYLKCKGISKTEFGERIGVSNAYVTSIRKSIQPDKLQAIALNYPDLNTSWLLTGEGEMLKATQSVGDITNSNVSGVNVNGKEIHINPDAYQTLLKIVESNQKTTEKFQEQIDRLISVIEKKYDSENR